LVAFLTFAAPFARLDALLTPPSWRFAPKGEGTFRMLRVAPRCAALEIP